MSGAGRSPIEMLFDQVEMCCTVCGEKAGTCDCWTECPCGWFFQTDGGKCGNPVHG